MSDVTRTYSSVVIGAGSGGLTVAIGLAALGRRVALIEGHHVGGDCTNVGCVPSKTLIHLADEQLHDPDSRAVLAKVQAKRNHLRDEETQHVADTPDLNLIKGWARFLEPKRLAVTQPDGTTIEITADNIVIATGSRPRWIDIPGLPAERALTNETIFEQEEAPRYMVIVGSGVIAMEMAFAFRKLGTAVTMITRGPRVMSSAIPEVAAAMHAALTERGVTVYYNATPSAYDSATETLHIQSNDLPVDITGVDRVLLATGRVRNLEKLDLERSGVAFDPKRGIAVDSYGQTNVRGIYAIGDVTPTSHFTHSANAQGRRVVQRIAFPWLPARSPEPFYPSAIYSDPEIASVGLTPEQIAQKYHPGLIKKMRFDLEKTDRGYTDSVKHSFVILYVVRLTGRILSATIVGPQASAMISLLNLAISQRISIYKLYSMVFPYPTLSEGIKKTADTFVRETLPNLKTEIPAYLRYRWATPPQPNGQPEPREQTMAEAQK